MLISIDGIDGCGKSTQVRLLAEALGATAIQEISPSRWGKALRGSDNPSLAQQLAWFTADRAVLAETLEAAAGSETNHIVSDRSYLSGVAYQSFDSVLTPEFVEDLNRAIVPDYDLQVYLHVPVEVALARVDARGIAKTWCEKPDRLTWASEVFACYARERDFVVQIDGYRTIEEVAVDMAAAAEAASTAAFGRRVW